MFKASDVLVKRLANSQYLLLMANESSNYRYTHSCSPHVGISMLGKLDLF